MDTRGEASGKDLVWDMGETSRIVGGMGVLDCVRVSGFSWRVSDMVRRRCLDKEGRVLGRGGTTERDVSAFFSLVLVGRLDFVMNAGEDIWKCMLGAMGLNLNQGGTLCRS